MKISSNKSGSTLNSNFRIGFKLGVRPSCCGDQNLPGSESFGGDQIGNINISCQTKKNHVGC